MNLDGSQATPNGNISINILKLTVDIYLPFMTNILNLLIKEGHFLDELKLAEVNTIKKKDYLDKENYRPFSTLPHM